MNSETAQLDYEIIWDDEDKPEQVIDCPLERKLDGLLVDDFLVVAS